MGASAGVPDRLADSGVTTATVTSPGELETALLHALTALPRRDQLSALTDAATASEVCGLLVLESGVAAANHIFHLVAVTIVVSILLDSSTDVVIARVFDDEDDTPAWHGVPRRRVRTLQRR